MGVIIFAHFPWVSESSEWLYTSQNTFLSGLHLLGASPPLLYPPHPCSLIYKGHFHSNYNMVVFTIKQEQAACLFQGHIQILWVTLSCPYPLTPNSAHYHCC